MCAEQADQDGGVDQDDGVDDDDIGWRWGFGDQGVLPFEVVAGEAVADLDEEAGYKGESSGEAGKGTGYGEGEVVGA